ncbi:DUF2207 domain-containing protein [Nocardioides jiangxiensis]|uniref:DUF2207 domain-containing protein n=1 Tax=Nocardioides jiangxiensis TaxID=3064524 RepID=A0ABT9AYJ4_9ACTN|nr:DUF2207 domain-containing protein [Nocardioides sp. WY-20]MDO7867651.1 DUF2207 domain-containing protein [Nocardioides sp. WY-20]
MRGKNLSNLSVGLLTILASLLAFGAVVAWPVIASQPDSGGSAYDPATIRDYKVELTVDGRGTLHAVETLQVSMPDGRHGIFRFWDVGDGVDPHRRNVPHDIAVTQDGAPATVDLQWQQGRRFRVAQIGDAGTTLRPGLHTWVISYDVDDVLRPPGAFTGQGSWSGTPRGSELIWDVVPGGWRMPISKAEVTVSLPSAAHDARCDVALVACDVTTDGSTVRMQVGPLPPDTAVTLSTRLDTKPSAGSTLPWSPGWDVVLGRNLWVAIGLALLGLVALVIGRLVERSTRESDPGFPVLFEPPAGLGPVQTAYVANERVPKAALSATLLHLGERGFVELEHHEDNSWTVVGKRPESDWSELDEISRTVGHALGVTSVGGSFHVDRHKGAGQELAGLVSSLPGAARRWGIESGNLSMARNVPWLRVVFGLAVLVTLLAGFVAPSAFGLIAWPSAAFVIGAVGLVRAETTTYRTRAGRDTWSRAGGFRRMLSTDSAESRFDFAARKDLYTAFVPFAVAFGCAEAWARKYEAATGTAAPVPLWYGGGYVGGNGGGFGSGSFDSFDSAVSSSISAYQASQARSSGGGGGFGGGGFGGGGGGGGSW